MDALNDQDPKDKPIIDRIARSNINKQPDIFIQVSVPHEFQKVGKYNIGITAGIETTLCSADWIQGLNNMDLIVTVSEHSKSVFINTVYDKINEKTKQKEAEVTITVTY